MVKPGTDQCIAYDSRYQATSLTEAVTQFLDLTLTDILDRILDNDDDDKAQRRNGRALSSSKVSP